MPLRRARRTVRRKAPRRKARNARKRMPMKRKEDFARLVETTETQIFSINDLNADSVGGVLTWSLADYQRGQEVAHAYKYYRCAKAEVVFLPYFNVSQLGGGAASRIPQMYYTVDRVANKLIAPTESEMLERGVSPKLFNKKLKFSWKPNILQEVNFETGQPADGGGNPLGINILGALNSIAVFNKWLPTQQGFGYHQGVPQIAQQIMPNGINPYSIQYYGAAYVPAVEGMGTTAIYCGDLQLRVTWEFKGPRALKTNLPTVPPNPYASTSTSSGATPNTQPTRYP